MNAEGMLFTAKSNYRTETQIHARGLVRLSQMGQQLAVLWQDHSQQYDIPSAITEELQPALAVTQLMKEGGAVTFGGVRANRTLPELMVDMPAVWREDLKQWGFIKVSIRDCVKEQVRLGVRADVAESLFIFHPSFVTKIGYTLSAKGGISFNYTEEANEQIVAYERAKGNGTWHERRALDAAFVPIQMDTTLGALVVEERKTHPTAHPFLHVTAYALARGALLDMVGQATPRKGNEDDQSFLRL